MTQFVHLHCHSHYSLLDGAGNIGTLIKRAKELQMPAIALTDHGNLFGMLEFYQAATKAGIKPILGYEAYIAPESRLIQSGAKSAKDAAFHLTLLAMNEVGYKNLLKLSSLAYTEGFYYHARIDKEILSQYNEGLICLSGCPGGELSRCVLKDEKDGVKNALEIASWYKNLFGDRYYLEVQETGLESQRIFQDAAEIISQELKIPIVATNDVHYVYETDAEAQDVLLCINTKAFRTDEKRMRMDGGQYFMRSGDEMLRAMPNHKDAIERTLEIAQRIECKLELGKRFFPVFTPPAGKTSDDYLRELCLDGLKKRYADNPKRLIDGVLADDVLARLDRELNVIKKLGFPNYFLIVWDFVRVAEERGIHRTARGSGVGALVCYALGMSHVCPLEFDLLFERFLDEQRVEAPDIDIDFDQNRRGEILDYVKEKYGNENVAQIGTIGTMAAKMSIKDVGRALGMSIPEVNAVTSLISDAPKTTIQSTLNDNEAFKDKYNSNSDIKELVDLALQLEGLARSSGTHACAVVIADKPLTEYLPLQLDKKEGIVTQWTMGDVEKAGLLKMDFLGLRNLSILAQAIELVKQTTGKTIDPYRFPLDDKETFDLLCRGETKGIFQLEGGGIREMLQRMRPDNFRDIIATLALYRPGPLEGGMTEQYIDVKHGRKKAEFLHPVMREVLEETHGVMIYQEQIMQILNKLGKIPLPDAYSCIKAISKKIQEKINKFEGDFVKGASENGVAKDEAQKLFDMIKVFAGYGFNKSHSTAYALIAYMTAYLKAHYPKEFMAALLCGDMSGRNFTQKDSTVEHIEDCERMGIKVAPPDINNSDGIYSIKNGNIYFALEAIKGVREGAGEIISKARSESGEFSDLFDFCSKIDVQKLGKASIEALIKAGAFDVFGCFRSQLISVLERAYKGGLSSIEDRKKGQKNLFDMFGDDEPAKNVIKSHNSGLPEIGEWPLAEKSGFEKEVLGFYVSSHPLKEQETTLQTFRTHTAFDAARLSADAYVTLAGQLSEIKLTSTKNPKPGQPSKYAMFTLEDAFGSIRCIMWPQQYAKFADLVKSNDIVFAVGRIDRSRSQKEDDANLIVDELLTLEQATQKMIKGIAVMLSETEHGETGLKRLYEIIRGYPGDESFELWLKLANGKMAMLKCGTKILYVPQLRTRITEAFGEQSIRILKNSVTNPVENNNKFYKPRNA